MAKKTRKKIAIIEDEQALLWALCDQLSSSDYELLTAVDGKFGLEVVKKQKPDLILLDIVLPKMDGFSVLRALKKDPKTKNIPVVILSNLAQDEDKIKGLKLGAEKYIVKTDIDIEDLPKKIKEYLS
ncbi:response regulator [Candidatus Parcubacteria bacterium]|jgi:DNA-binding response OmpR family regulator|nr:response regulator [Candidatus Parcubacteria bacterium]MBT3949156.1 response regulator [Candidatus Parcubacteria bacterium]